VSNTGGEDAPTLDVPRATVLAQLLPGPLRERLRTAVDWTVFNVGGSSARGDDFIRWTLVDGGLDATLQPPRTVAIIVFHTDSIEFSVEYDNEGFVPCGLLVEMRAEHSNER
jgi:hypothetical protein